MIDREQMFEPMLAVIPGFRPVWQELRREWADEPDGLPHYRAIAALAHYLIELLEQGRCDELACAFVVVERWHTEGDDYVKEAATVGLLEDLQNEGLHTTTKPEEFRCFLHAESHRWWDKVIQFWRDGRMLSDDD